MITSKQVHLKNAHKTPAVLDAVDRAVHERVGRHRHHRRGVADVAGNVRRAACRQAGAWVCGHEERRGACRRRGSDRRRLCRPDLAVQHLRPHRLGVVVRQARAQADLLHLLHARRGCCTCCASFGADWKSMAILVGAFCIIASMYGGGFATIPAYLADMFGTQFVGAIHGRLLTAWSTAGILGPVIVNYLHDQRVAEGVAVGSDLRADLLHPGRAAGGRLHRQPARAPRRCQVAHERRRR